MKMCSKKLCTIKGTKDASPDCYAIVRGTIEKRFDVYNNAIVRGTIEKRFEVYNNITESWHPLDSGKGSIYKTKNAARKAIDGLCAKYQQTCFFLVSAKKC